MLEVRNLFKALNGNEILKNIKDKPPVFNWKRYFRRLIGNSISSEIQSTRMRPSKRFPDAKGIRLKRKPNILVGVDTSGSVSMEELNDYLEVETDFNLVERKLPKNFLIPHIFGDFIDKVDIENKKIFVKNSGPTICVSV